MDRNNRERAGVQYYVRRSGSARKEGRRPSDIGGKGTPGNGNSKHKSAEAGGSLGFSRNSKEASVAGAE